MGTQSSSLLFKSNHDRRRFKSIRSKSGFPSTSSANQSGGSLNESKFCFNVSLRLEVVGLANLHVVSLLTSYNVLVILRSKSQ